METFIWAAVSASGALEPLRQGLPVLELILFSVAGGVVLSLTLDILRWRPTSARLTLPRDPVLLQSLMYLTREVWPTEMETSIPPTFRHLTHKGAVAARLRQALEDLERRPGAKAEIIEEAARARAENAASDRYQASERPVRLAATPGANGSARPAHLSTSPAR